jgi:rubredoxin
MTPEAQDRTPEVLCLAHVEGLAIRPIERTIRPPAVLQGYTRGMTTWRCLVCGCDFDEAQAKRRRRHEPPIGSVVVQTCSSACEEKREAARAQARRERRARHERRVHRVRKRRRNATRPRGYWRRRYRRLRVPRELAWRCRECNCTFAEAQAKRRRHGERAIRSLLARTCSARCRRIYRTRIIRRWDRLHPEAVKEYQRRAMLKRRRKRAAMRRGSRDVQRRAKGGAPLARRARLLP